MPTFCFGFLDVSISLWPASRANTCSSQLSASQEGWHRYRKCFSDQDVDAVSYPETLVAVDLTQVACWPGKAVLGWKPHWSCPSGLPHYHC